MLPAILRRIKLPVIVSQLMTSADDNAPLPSLAVLTALSTFPLIFMGGLVTSHQAGLAVPDWPNSFGYNMFLFPPRYWVGGILYEHTHRLAATVVGMLSILLCIIAFRTETRRWVKWLALGVLAAVCFQGVLGGLRVVLVKLDLAIIHGCFAQAFFCLTALMAVVTSRWWKHAPDLRNSDDSAAGRRLVISACLAVAVVYGQLVIGAIMRHEQAGLAAPINSLSDIPLIYGKIFPPTTTAQLTDINKQRVWKMNLPAVTLAQIWLHYAHRVGALIVSLVILGLASHVFLFHRQRKELLSLASFLLALLATQLVLGLATVYYRKPADVASAHVAVGALLLVTTFVLAARATRLYWRGTTVDSQNSQEIPMPGNLLSPA